MYVRTIRKKERIYATALTVTEISRLISSHSFGFSFMCAI